MADDTSLTAALCFRVFLCFFLASLCAASCEKDAVGLADGHILDSQLSASTELSASTPAKNGRLNYTAGSSWCASTSDSNPYLQIDLQTLYIICAVSTQGNSQGDQWVEKYTLQSSTDGTTWTDYKEHGQSNKRSFNGNYDKDSTVKHILYGGIVGRYLRFVSRVEHGEVCLRVEIFGVPRSKGNIALFKPTSQSGTLATFKSSYAVDGSKDTHYTNCSHTDDNTNKNPWWRVDLGRVEPVAEVFILNNGDLNGAEIRVGNSSAIGGADSYLCATAVAVPAGTSKTFFCKPIAYGRYVSISFKLGVTSKYLKLCEVEVHSSYISNLALDQPASQISDIYGGVASRAVDGNTNNNYGGGSCTHTKLETNPWWRVDLGSPLPVAEVVIVNRQCTDACADVLKAFEIRIGNSNLTGGQSNPSCGGTHSMVTGETKSFYCTPRLLGRFVYVLVRAPPSNKKLLTICELEVYSTKQSMNDVKGCANDPVGVSNSVNFPYQRFSASSSLSSSSPSNGRLKGASAWIPGTNSDNNDYLQIDLGSVYFVCGVAVQGNPAANKWTTTYKIETSLDNVNWKFYSENGAVKSFTGNNDRNSIIRSELYEPLAAKFIRFYPVSFNTSKALRVEVYGSLQGCLSTVGNERGVTRDLGIRASSQLDGTHTPSYSRLYGIGSWCSSLSGPLPHYLEFDFRSVITVTGLATQGDAVNYKWVTKYTINYGYDRQRWISYAAGKELTGNSDRSTVVVNWLSEPFAAQYVKIFPTSHYSGICMRMDLFICKDFQVPFILANQLKDVQLTANTNASVTLNCTARFSRQRPPLYEWRKGAAVLSESDSYLTITYISATHTHKNYNCARMATSGREFNCSSTYQCTASLLGVNVEDVTTANVIALLKVPGPPTVNSGNIKARSASVTWSYSPRSDELSIDKYTLQYQNRSFDDNITLSGGLSSKDLINLKPYTSYSVRMMAKSALGEGLWSNLVNFTTKSTVPEVTVQFVNVTGRTSQSIYVEWQKPDFSKLNGPLQGYTISYREAGKPAVTVTPSGSLTSWTLSILKKYTKYLIAIRVTNGDYPGPWSTEKEAWTKQDAPSEPRNLQLRVFGPSGNARPQMTVSWGKPANENGIITKYTLVYTCTFQGNVITTRHITNSGIFRYSFDVLGGIQYTVNVWAETIKPGPNATNAMKVLVYAPSIAPRNITSKKINETTYRISWDPLPREMSNGEVIAYEVNQTMISNSCTARAIPTATIVLVNTTDTFTVLSGLKACSKYSVQVRAYTTAGPGVFGSILLDNVTSVPEVTIQVVSVTALSSRSIYVEWQEPDLSKLNGPLRGYSISYKEAGKAAVTVSAPSSSTYLILSSLKKWTKYFIKIAVTNGDFFSPWSDEKEVWTKQDAPSEPQNLRLQVLGPSKNARPQMTVSWGKPANENGIITKYTLAYTYDFEGKMTTRRHSTNSGKILSYSFDVLGGIQYIVNLWAETIKPGPNATNAALVPVYAPSIAPSNITSKKINEQTYIISWNPLPREMSNGEVIAYEVNQTMVSRSCAARDISSAAIVLVNTTNTFKVLSGLKACSQYNVIVRAYTTAGPGVFSNILRRIVTTVPLAPTNLFASSPQSTSVTLNWKKPSLNSELVETYQILFNGTKSYFKGFKDSRVIDTSGPVLTYEVDTLLPGTEYTFAVRAKSSCGLGDVGNGVVVETKVDYPRSPNVSVVEKISTPNTSISVGIWGVKPYNGPISHYQVIVQRVNNWADEIPEKNKKKLLDYDESQKEKQGFYIAAELQSELIHPSLTFDIGDGKRYGTYNNVALAKSQKYKIYIRAVTTSPKYLPGRETLTAMVTIMEDEHGRNEQINSPGDKPSNTVLVISNIILGVAFALSLGVNVYLWRVRRTPKTGEKYLPKEIQVDAPQNEQGDADTQALQLTSDYMELRPTQAQLTSNTSEYRSLTWNGRNDTESKQAYANVDFHQLPEVNENELYEDINT